MRTVGIIAPLIDTRQFHSDFDLKLTSNNRELTLAALYEFAQKGFDASQVSRGIAHEEDIPAAGYYLEGLLRQKGYDTLLTNRFDKEALEAIAARDPFAILVSTTMIVSTDSLKKLFSSIRQIMPDTVIIAGGVLVWKNFLLYQKYTDPLHSSPLPSWLLFHSDHAGMDADILVAAPHGRSSLLQILEELEKGNRTSFEHIPNLALPGKKGFTFTSRDDEAVDYNKDYTRWDLVEKITYKIPIRTSIGCPYRCRFCDFYPLFPRIFLRSAESLGEELKLIKARSERIPAILHVSDDNVFINKSHLEKVCTTIADSGLKRWIGFMRAGEYSDIEMDLIERSGLQMGILGVESGDPGQLERMNKRQKIEEVKRGVEQLDAHGISTVLMFIVGFPGETEQSLENTTGFLNSLSLPNSISSYQLYPLLINPVSDLDDHKFRKQWNIEGFMEKWTHYTMNSEEAYDACYSLFKKVTNVPYHYFEESNFFNRAKFRLNTRKSLFQLRQQLTIKLIENASWEDIEFLLKSMAQQMNLPVERIDESIRQELSVGWRKFTVN